MSKILFIDRDGTLINEPRPSLQVDSLEKLSFEKGAIPALLALKKFGFKFVLVSNQDGLGTPNFPRENFELAQNKMLEILNDNDFKARLSFSYVCTHCKNQMPLFFYHCPICYEFGGCKILYEVRDDEAR